MQQLQHKQFTTLPTGRQVQHTLSSLAIRYWYVPAGSGFTPDSNRDESMSNDDKKRPWNER
jgi:hypothetical protein